VSSPLPAVASVRVGLSIGYEHAWINPSHTLTGRYSESEGLSGHSGLLSLGLHRLTGNVPATTHFSVTALRPAISLADLFSAVRTAWPATRPAHSFLEFRAYPLNMLSSGFRFLDGDNPADPLIAREWRNILPFFPSNGIGNENFSQIRWYVVHRARRDRFLAHKFHFTSIPSRSGSPRMLCYARQAKFWNFT
jgi:hypothetical protein